MDAGFFYYLRNLNLIYVTKALPSPSFFEILGNLVILEADLYTV